MEGQGCSCTDRDKKARIEGAFSAAFLLGGAGKMRGVAVAGVRLTFQAMR
jgi:hypothetical protein